MVIALICSNKSHAKKAMEGRFQVLSIARIACEDDILM